MNSTASQHVSHRLESQTFPEHLDITPCSRNPLVLPRETVEAVTTRPVPTFPLQIDAAALSVSIVVVTFNNLVFNRLCLETLLAHTDYGNYEVIVVDNGSSDGTVAYLTELHKRHSRVRLVLNATNKGFAAANNQALREAAGQVLVLLNNDTIVTPGWLERLVTHLVDPPIGLVGATTNRIGNEAEIETTYRTLGEMFAFADAYTERHLHRAFEIPTPCMFCVGMRRDVYVRVGPLDERFRIGMLEDDDYALRVRAAGYRLVCAEDVFVHHFGQASFGSLVPTGEYNQLLMENQQRFAEKWGHTWQPYSRRRSNEYTESTQRIGRAVSEATTPGATVLVVSKGDEELLAAIAASGRVAAHFPQASDGRYAGFYPADSSAAIEALALLRREGAQHLVIPRIADWWLTHYSAFADYLHESSRHVHDEPDACLIFSFHETDGAGVTRSQREGASA